MRFRSCLILAGLLFWSHGAAAEWATIVFESKSGVILQAEKDRAPRYPASLTKIMSSYLVLEALKSGRLNLSDALPISAAAAQQAAVRLGLKKGRTITVKQALEAMILRSANDAAVVLAEAVAGDERSFAFKMSEKARILGMRGTTFANATGLPAQSQVTTAYDMAILARALVGDFPDRFPLFSQTSFAYEKRRYSSINGWLAGYAGADGIKTGFTCAAGYNLVASAKRDGQRLIAVVMGGMSSGARGGKARSLMDAAFAKVGKPRGTLPDMGILGKNHAKLKSWVPPHVLPGDRCALSKREPQAVLENGPYPGWGLIFGTFASKTKALAEIDKIRTELGELTAGGRPAVVLRTRGGVERYSALLVALREDLSLTACQRLRKSGSYCLRLRPEVLNNKQARWR